MKFKQACADANIWGIFIAVGKSSLLSRSGGVTKPPDIILI